MSKLPQIFEKNREGLTHDEWFDATCIDIYLGGTYDHPTQRVLKKAWRRGEDPADYHPSAGQFESYHAWCIRGGMKVLDRAIKVEAWQRNDCPKKFLWAWRRAKNYGKTAPPTNATFFDSFKLIGSDELNLAGLPECERAGMAEHLHKQREMRDLLANARDDWDNLPDAEPEGSIVVRPSR